MNFAVWGTLVLCSIGAGDTTLLEFCSPTCGPCQQMRPVVQQLTQQGYPLQVIDVSTQPVVARRYQVDSVPTFVVLMNGREAGRLVGACSLGELQQLCQRAGMQPTDAPLSTSQLPRPSARPMVAATAAPANNAAPLVPVRWNEAAGGQNVAAAYNSSTPSPTARSGQASETNLVVYNARLKIEDPNGHSWGSGTVIDARGEEALVLTCGHVFRDSNGKGKITVDLFGPEPMQGLTAHVIGFDLKSDVGLISVQTPKPLKAARLAPRGSQLRNGDAVVSVGCPHGGEPTVEAARVNSINKYLGPPNVQVSGLPIQGRSGGGLFTPDGQVIGVCNAADPQANEGLYAGLESIYVALEKAELLELFQQQQSAPANVAAAPLNMAAPAHEDLAALPTPMATSNPAAQPQQPSSLPASVPAGRGGALSQQEHAALSEIYQKGEYAEVVCVIRPLNDPRAKSEIIVLDRASPEFLKQLVSERTTQDAKYLTKFKSPAAQEQTTAKVPSNWQPKWVQPAGK